MDMENRPAGVDSLGSADRGAGRYHSVCHRLHRPLPAADYPHGGVTVDDREGRRAIECGGGRRGWDAILPDFFAGTFHLRRGLTLPFGFYTEGIRRDQP